VLTILHTIKWFPALAPKPFLLLLLAFTAREPGVLLFFGWNMNVLAIICTLHLIDDYNRIIHGNNVTCDQFVLAAAAR
jgi:hypothetical protein